MKIGMNLLFWTTFLTEEHLPLCESLHKTGFDGVEVPLGDADSSHYSAMGKALTSLGLERTTVISLEAETNPVSRDPAIRSAAIDRLKWAIEMSNAIGSTLMCGPYHSAFKEFTGFPPTEDEWKRSVEVIRLAAEFAEPANVTLALETLNRFESYLFNTVGDAKRFVQRVDHPNCRIMYDTHHSNIEERDPATAIENCADVLAHVHISENHRGTPGTGQVKWPETFAALKNVDYDNWLTIEAFSTRNPDFAYPINVWREFADSAEDVYRDGYAFIRRMWG